ncbi:MAG: PTS sugar transporter subunit IIA, partial [bacterium]|nr:PTS sugar transporter subunit IIA [bacterium]
IEHPEMVLVRSLAGVHIVFNDPLTHHQEEEQTLHAIFFLFSPEDNPTKHLRVLAQIAGRVDDEGFAADWDAARDEQELKETLLHDERCLSLLVQPSMKTEAMIGRVLREIDLPAGCLVAMLRRGGHVLIPKGNTVFEEDDRLTVIGDPEGLREIEARYGESAHL